MFQRLLAKLVSGQVISLDVGCGGSFMSVGGNVVQFRGSNVCALWHGGLLYGAFNDRECSSGEPLGKPPTALAGQAYTGISFFSSESPDCTNLEWFPKSGLRSGEVVERCSPFWQEALSR
jgi:hypothetical protein